MSFGDQTSLRRKMLGTTTVASKVEFDDSLLGPSATRLLLSVANHSAKASATYYWKWLAQYLKDYSLSLRELTHRLRARGTIVLVAQDSHYKDIRIDLPLISIEIMLHNGWRLERSYDFALSTTMAGVNRGTHRYRDEFSACERVLVFNRR
jgi:hypothetical protein